MDQDSFNILSLCSGCAGLDLGLRLAIPGARTVCYVEREVVACEILAARMADKALDEAPIWTDLKTFDGKPWRGRVHCVTAGFPCQPFSVIGQKLGKDDPRHLWPDVARVVAETDAPLVFFENVANLLNIGYDSVRGELRRLGYAVEAGIFSAAEVGAPHVRRRLFILGHAEGRAVGLSELEQGEEVQDGGRDSRMDGEGDGEAGAEPPFPPGPKRWKEWEALIKRDHKNKPAFYGLDDELADGVDKSPADEREALIRVVGNGVVPSCAAYAFSILLKRVQNRLGG